MKILTMNVLTFSTLMMTLVGVTSSTSMDMNSVSESVQREETDRLSNKISSISGLSSGRKKINLSNLQRVLQGEGGENDGEGEPEVLEGEAQPDAADAGNRLG